jgi:Ser/Thr protein kinase RdoA (MazF antagonist)
VPSGSGELLVADSDFGWCLARHIDGFNPDPRDPNIYMELVGGLARFHAVLSSAHSRCSIDAPAGICVAIRRGIERLNSSDFVPFTGGPDEENVLRRAAGWLLPRLIDFEHLPRQLIHGDWTPQNILFRIWGQQSSLTAVLDFERMGLDPIHVDVANVCSTLVMWSGLDTIAQRVQAVLDDYEWFSGQCLDREHIHVAMLGHWFCQYWSWRDRMMRGESREPVKARLFRRVASVLDYIEHTSNP